MANAVGVYFDSSTGLVACIVNVQAENPNYVPSEADFAPHERKGFARVNVAQSDYAGKPALNWGGVPVYRDLTAFALPQLSKVSAAAASAAQAVVNSVDTQIAAYSKSVSDYQSAYDTFTASLSPLQLTTLDDGSAVSSLLLTPTQQSLYSAIPPVPVMTYTLPAPVITVNPVAA